MSLQLHDAGVISLLHLRLRVLLQPLPAQRTDGPETGSD